MTMEESSSMYELFVNSGLSPEDAASLVDGIAALRPPERRELSEKITANSFERPGVDRPMIQVTNMRHS